MQIEGKEIPDSVVMEILSRLPVKSMAQFRCVCKHWYSSLQTSYFITKHHRNNADNKDKPLNLFFFENPHLRRGAASYFPYVYGPCNGLFCLYNVESLGLWNPFTREYRVIPIPTFPPPPPPPFRIVGQPRSFVYGFGYDSIRDDYKVVRIQTGVEGCKVELFSLKTDSWKEISAPHPCPHPRPYRKLWFNNYVDGFYYWHSLSADERNVILSFDMANEKFSTLPWPTDSNSNDHVRGQLELLNVNGLLGAVAFSRGEYVDLWVMMNGSWTKRFSIDPFPQLQTPLGFSKMGELFFMSSNNELALLDPATNEVKNLGIRVDRYRYSLKFIAYDESLVPINGTSDEEHLIRRPAGSIQIDSILDNTSKPRIYML